MVGLDFENERYIRVYTRDTMKWMTLSFEAQGLYCLLLRKADRSGIIDIEGGGRRAAAIIIGHNHRWDALSGALDELESAGMLKVTDKSIAFVDFIEGQEAIQSDRMRQKESRKRRNSSHLSRNVTDPSRNVTECHDTSTSRDEMSLQPSLTNLTEPTSQTEDQPSEVERVEGVLVAEFARFFPNEKYRHAYGRDRKAIKALLADHSEEEILTRWRKGLVNTQYPKVRSIHQLDTVWSFLASPSVSPQATTRDMTKVVVGFDAENNPIYGTNP